MRNQLNSYISGLELKKCWGHYLSLAPWGFSKECLSQNLPKPPKRKVPGLALFSFQCSELSSLHACSSFFPFPSQDKIFFELEGEKEPNLLPVESVCSSLTVLLRLGSFSGKGFSRSSPLNHYMQEAATGLTLGIDKFMKLQLV